MATAIPSAGSPASDLAPVASIASLGSMVAASMVADSTVAASTVGRLFAAEQGSAVSARELDTRAASAGDNWTSTLPEWPVAPRRFALISARRIEY